MTFSFWGFSFHEFFVVWCISKVIFSIVCSVAAACNYFFGFVLSLIKPHQVVVVQSITGEISASKLFHRIQLLLEVCFDPDWTNIKGGL